MLMQFTEALESNKLLDYKTFSILLVQHNDIKNNRKGYRVKNET